MENQFSPALVAWVEKVIEKCTPNAEKFNLEYYPLQSKAKLNPEILFIGLNPGGGYGYDCQINNPDWEFDKLNSKLTAQRLLKGNPSFDKEFFAGKWKYGNGLRKIAFLKNAIDKYDFVFTNYIYYSSTSFSEINKNELTNAIQENISQTLDLINLINPKHIIVLGTGTGIDKISKSNKVLIQGFKKRLLVQGELNGKIVYGIPHPSYNNFPAENDAISETLRRIMDGDVVEPFTLHNSEEIKPKLHKPTSKFNSESFLRNFENYNPEQTEKWIDIVFKGLNNDEILIRINPKKKEFGIRNTDKKNYTELQGESFYNQFFDKTFERKKNSWFISKQFKKFHNINFELSELVDAFLSAVNAEKNKIALK